ARIDQLIATARQIASQLDHATMTPLRTAVEPGAPPMAVGDTQVYPAIELTKQTGNGKRFVGQSQLYVATPAVLRYLGIDPKTIDPSADFLLDRSVNANELVIPSMPERRLIPVTNVQKIEVGEHLFGADSGRTPANFVTLNGLRRHGWKQTPAGWLLESNRPLTSGQIAEARDAAAQADLTTDVRRKKRPPRKVRATAPAAGALLALAILAMPVGLIRGENASDLRTLTATGATPRIRRTLTATTAGALALLGALLGVAGAYVAMVAVYHDELSYLSDVPFIYLALAIIGVPLAAAAAGWLLAGRDPPAIARPVIE